MRCRWRRPPAWSASCPTAPSVADGASHAVEVDYVQAFAGAGLEPWARSAADPAIELVVPAAWLQAGTELPTGWALRTADRAAPYTRAIVSEGSVTLQRGDGSTAAFTATVGAPGQRRPRGSDGAGSGAGLHASAGAVFGTSASITDDSLGQVAGTTSGVGTLAMTYGAADRLTTVSRDGGAVANALVYDAASRPIAAGFPANRTTGVLGYGLDGRLPRSPGPGPTGVP